MEEKINITSPEWAIDLSIFPEDILEDYNDDIKKLPLNSQKELIKLWQQENKKNIGVFIYLIKEIKESWTKEIEQAKINNKTNEQQKILDNDTLRLKRAELLETTNQVLRYSLNISQWTNGQFDTEIDTTVASIQNGNVTPEISEFLEKNNIDPKNKEQLARPEVQNIIRAWVSTEVYLKNKALILQNNPNLAGDMANIESLSYNFWGEKRATSKNIETILTDQPQKNREKIQETTQTLTKDHPDTIITRKWDVLTFDDPKNKNNQYEINIANYPPILTKKRNGLEIRMQLSGNTEKPDIQKVVDKNKKLDANRTTIMQIIADQLSLAESQYMPMESANHDSWAIQHEEEAPILPNETKKELGTLASIRLPEEKKKFERSLGKIRNILEWTSDRLKKQISETSWQLGDFEEMEKIMKRITLLQTKLEVVERIRRELLSRIENEWNWYEAIPDSTQTPLEKGINSFDAIADKNLEIFVWLKYDILGQGNMEELIRRANENDPTLKIDPSHNEPLSDVQKWKLLSIMSNLIRRENNSEGKLASTIQEAYIDVSSPNITTTIQKIREKLDPNRVRNQGERTSEQMINDAITGKSPREWPNNSN